MHDGGMGDEGGNERARYSERATVRKERVGLKRRRSRWTKRRGEEAKGWEVVADGSSDGS